TLAHPHPMIGKQFAQFCLADDFGAEIAPARTFATAEQLRATRGQEPGPEVEALCVVAYDDRLSAQQALSQPFARHKLLDLIGDLFLCGRPLQGAITAVKTGHRDNHEFLARLLAQSQRGKGG
ncbi:MAG: UDP-3-O-acyl-N-acetylglucosamine deacetylase, partial [Armatimonadota bacterium]